jgi:hypothetical protein
VSRESTTSPRSLPLNRNAKTGLVLAAVALAFFAAIVAKYWLLR